MPGPNQTTRSAYGVELCGPDVELSSPRVDPSALGVEFNSLEIEPSGLGVRSSGLRVEPSGTFPVWTIFVWEVATLKFDLCSQDPTT